jgi:alkanesulfonate monooxygenase SsuD/methylene tetrahydromethanopterin reductase-like flavin-dependent oxidoreductase (luciferase family)
VARPRAAAPVATDRAIALAEKTENLMQIIGLLTSRWVTAHDSAKLSWRTSCSSFAFARGALRVSGSRMGLGTGPVHWTNGYYGMPYDRPVSRLREVVQIIRQVEDGARTGTMKPWRGDCYQLEFHGYEPTAPPYRERLPVWSAALRPRMCELAGEVADGLTGHPVWSVEWSLGQAQRSLAVGAASAGRDATRVHFQPWVTVSIDRDPKVAVNDAKPFAAFYAGFAQYHPYFDAHGFGPQARRLQAASNSMRPAEAASLVSDEMVKT